MTDNQTPENREQEKLLIFGWITTVLGLPENGDPTQYNKLTDKLYELRTATTLASNKALRERFEIELPEIPYYDDVLKAFDRALERQQLGKESSDDISLCPHCNCMTHTTSKEWPDATCGKCGGYKGTELDK